MNRAQKGKRIERQLEEILNAAGFVTHKATSNRFNRNDIFGCFDLAGKFPASPDSTLYIQVSTQWKCGKALKEIEAWPAGSNDLVLLSRKKDREDFEFKLMYGRGDWRKVQFCQIMEML